MRVAIVGGAPTWTDAPYADPSWTIWAHTSCQPQHLPRVDQWFDLHCVPVWRQGKVWYRPAGDEPPTYVEWLRSRPEPVVMQQAYPVIPMSVAYPLRDIVEAFGIVPASWGLTPEDPRWWGYVKDRGEFSATVCYMLALALWLGVEELALYGVDFSRKVSAAYREWEQRPGAKYWVGVARGLGIPVTVARGSWFEEQAYLYGYQVRPEGDS
jgi:hypothetical protein